MKSLNWSVRWKGWFKVVKTKRLVCVIVCTRRSTSKIEKKDLIMAACEEQLFQLRGHLKATADKVSFEKLEMKGKS